MREQDIKRRKTLIERYGSEEAFQEAQREWTSKGGKRAAANKTSGLFQLTKEQRSAAGKKGYRAMLAKAREQDE